jgi:hypothetical protein
MIQLNVIQQGVNQLNVILLSVIMPNFMSPLKLQMIFSRSDITFVNMYQPQLPKTLFLLTSIIGSLINLIFFFGIIWFERNKNNRTLVNQLVSSLYSKSVVFILSILSLDIAMYTYGPLPEGLCLLEYWIRNGFTMTSILCLKSIFIVRYLFVFHLKNPTAAQGPIL